MKSILNTILQKDHTPHLIAPSLGSSAKTYISSNPQYVVKWQSKDSCELEHTCTKICFASFDLLYPETYLPKNEKVVTALRKRFNEVKFTKNHVKIDLEKNLHPFFISYAKGMTFASFLHKNNQIISRLSKAALENCLVTIGKSVIYDAFIGNTDRFLQSGIHEKKPFIYGANLGNALVRVDEKKRNPLKISWIDNCPHIIKMFSYNETEGIIQNSLESRDFYESDELSTQSKYKDASKNSLSEDSDETSFSGENLRIERNKEFMYLMRSLFLKNASNFVWENLRVASENPQLSKKIRRKDALKALEKGMLETRSNLIKGSSQIFSYCEKEELISMSNSSFLKNLYINFLKKQIQSIHPFPLRGKRSYKDVLMSIP